LFGATTEDDWADAASNSRGWDDAADAR